MVESNRIRILETEDYYVEIEYSSEVIAVHLPWIRVLNKKVYKELTKALKEYSTFFRVLGKEKLYAAVDTNDIKIKRFLKKLGFVRVGISGELDVYEREN